MTGSLRFLPHTLATLVVAALPICGGACNAQLATVLSADGGPDSATSSSGGAPCKDSPACNADPAVSSLRGTCVDGKCVCNPGVVVTSDGRCGDVVSESDASTTSPCEAKGGKCLPETSTAPPSYQPDKTLACTAKSHVCWVPIVSTGTPVCHNDPGCNEDPAVSALLGKCVFGICVCNSGYVQPSGKCAGTLPPECAKQAGVCRQVPATCAGGELESDAPTNQSCGDLVEAVCCLPQSTCKGGVQEAAGAGWVPVDFYCCNASKSKSPAICVNGWKTCRPGETPTSGGGGC